ncbi:S-adenosyl-L-methionine-dependent methyltransferase [Sordaria brevicollis]|uniref:S-adenosyl-L-methionine-dependent methyltransferase n=1 Tax=Sordaria brevicollis TaxID=83679 RepID=A0AAE0PHT9_SORBR|nr:S-adenosyl-L-methionine-dependent methyltransferase [Sordaria brevicollis]
MASNPQSPKSPKSPQSPKRNEGSSPVAGPAQESALISNEEQTEIGILPASHWQQQSAETEEEFDDDSASSIGSVASSTASLSDSIFEYRKIHGRTYHRDIGTAESWEPNDERHVEAMEIAHHNYTVCIGHRLYRAPLDKKKVQKAIDIGTGSGIWAMDFADEFPNAEVIGTDITPIQPSWVPPNLKFELDDCNQEWTWPDNTFDFIHVRMMFGVVEDWYKLHRQAFRTCKPGGYIETFISCTTFECDDGTVKEDSAMSQWAKVFNEGGRRFGRTFEVYENDLQRKGMEAAGFVDIEYKDYFIPVGGWGDDKEAAERGLWWKMTLEADLDGYLNYIFNTLKEWNDPKIHGYFRARSAWGRKPE